MSACTPVTTSQPAAPCRAPRAPPTCPPSPRRSTRAGIAPRAKVSCYITEKPHGNQGDIVSRKYGLSNHWPCWPWLFLRNSRFWISISQHTCGVFIMFSCQTILYFSKYFPCSRTWHVQGSEEVIKPRLEQVQIRSEGNKAGSSPGLRASDQVKILSSLNGLICRR